MKKLIYSLVVLLGLSVSLQAQDADSITFCYPKYGITEPALEDALEATLHAFDTCYEALDTSPRWILIFEISYPKLDSLSQAGDTILAIEYRPFFTWEDIGPRELGVVSIEDHYCFFDLWSINWLKSSGDCVNFTQPLFSSLKREQYEYYRDELHRSIDTGVIVLRSIDYPTAGCIWQFVNGEFSYKGGSCNCERSRLSPNSPMSPPFRQPINKEED